jgi:glucosamine 6-phosphate synthetase-like amidotransferase/phosphosugar isomerase protein
MSCGKDQGKPVEAEGESRKEIEGEVGVGRDRHDTHCAP